MSNFNDDLSLFLNISYLGAITMADAEGKNGKARRIFTGNDDIKISDCLTYHNDFGLFLNMGWSHYR